MYIVCSDLEGVFVPEIWVNVALQTGIEELKLTTRDISDYNVLMRGRINLLKKHHLKLADIQKVISKLQPLPGALDFINWVREVTQLIIVSDTFAEFADPLMKQLGRPTIFCHRLTVDNSGMITDYILRQKDAKMMTVNSMQNLNYKVFAIGDSYNDLSMLRKADTAVLFNPPRNVAEENSDLVTTDSYDKLRSMLTDILAF